MSLPAPPESPVAAATASVEAELRRREEYFRALTEQSLDIIAVLDAEGVIRFESPSVERWTGWTPEELVGSSVFALVHPEDLPKITERFRAGLTGTTGIDLVEHRYRHKNGTWRVLESWGHNLLHNEFVRGIVIYTRDITERRDGERRRLLLSNLMERLNTIESVAAVVSEVASVTDGFFGWDAFSFDLYGNKSSSIRHALNIDTVDGKRIETESAFDQPPEGSLTARVIEEGAKLILRDSESDPGAETIPFGDKGRRSASIMAVPVQGPHGVMAVLMIHSYTKRAYLVEDLHLLQEIAGHCNSALERIRTRIELVNNEQRYRTLVERLPVAVFVNQEGRIAFANPAASKLMHAGSPEELLGKPIAQFVLPEFESVVAERMERALRGEHSPWMEQRLKRLDQTIADVEISSLGTTFNGYPAVQSILIEITDRKRAAQRQAVQYAATRVLAQSNSPNTIGQFLHCIRDGLGWVVAELYLMDGVTRGLQLDTSVHPDGAPFQAFTEGARGHPCRKGDGLPGRVWQTNQVLWTENLVEEPGFLRRELAAWAGLRSGAAFPITVREEFFGVIQLFSTEPRPSDPALFELFKVLSTQFGQFLERKQIQQQLLQAQKMEAVGQLAGGVAHDFNNLLTIITGHSQLALTSPGLPPQIVEELDQISAAVDRAANLTRQLLTFSRKQVMQTHPLHLSEVVNELVKMLRRIIGEHVALTLQHAPNLPAFEGDVGMIEQVVMNLAVNARDAMPDGGDLLIRTDTVCIDAEQARHLPHAREGKFVRLEVRDNGCGMRPEILARVFEPFFTTKPVGQGTGLGLATAYGIVKQHNGWIEVDSHVGVGTTFRVFLPSCAASVAEPASAARKNGELRGDLETILLVEDEPPLRRLARKLLERSGYRVLDAESGHDAMRVWDENRSEIQLVLTDMVMPGGMSGRDLAMRLRERSPDLRIIFTSGYTTEIAGNLLERENIQFLAKPYTPQQLTQIIHDTLHAPRN